MSQRTLNRVKMFKCCSVHIWCLYLVCIILLAVKNDIVEAQELKPPAVDFSRHRIVQPTLHHGRTKREISSTRDTSGAHHSEVTLKVDVDGEEYVLDLRLNEDLVTDNHIVSYQKEGGETVLHKPKKEDLDICQYKGSIRGKPRSWVAISTCHGVRGIIYDGHQMRYIEPAQGNDVQSHHYIYNHSDLMSTFKCGYEGGITNNTNYDPLLLKKHHSEKAIERSRIKRYKRESLDDTQVRGPYNANKLSRYVELVLVADNREFKANDEDIYTVHRQMKDVANIINSVYSPLNIFIALVGVVVWTHRDEITLEENGDTTLTNFLHYRKMSLLTDIPNDNAQLLTRQKFQEGVVGKALKGPICTYEFSGGVATNHSEVIGLVAMTIAHEMGHNFGMEHDTEQDCECPDEKCIMSPSSTSVTPIHWSSCSLKSLALAFEKGMDYCLRNKPRRLFDSPTCGNGFVEPGEQCDCGRLADQHARSPCHACCDPDTCTLRSNATCAAGTCCDLMTCRPKSAGTECRSADRECDLPEYCTGHSEYCPADVHKMDSTPCGGDNHDQAYCVRGACRTHTDQCRLLWGTTGESSHTKCYANSNVKGTKNGNCGYDRVRKIFTPCAPQDAMCGTLHCRHLNERLEFGMESVATLSALFINNNGTIIPCRTAIIDLGLSDVDPGFVPDGAKCGDDMMCLHQKCVTVESVREAVGVKETSVCPSDCSGHGVCNSEGHCHCEPGFAPPVCALPGPGGSHDSGPATDPSVQRNFMVAMYVIFLGIIPSILLLLFLAYYSRHNVLLWWKKPKKSYVDYLSCTKPPRNRHHEKITTEHNSRIKFGNFIRFPNRKSSSIRKLLSFKRSHSIDRTLSNDLEPKKCNQYVVDENQCYANVAVVIKVPEQPDSPIYETIPEIVGSSKTKTKSSKGLSRKVFKVTEKKSKESTVKKNSSTIDKNDIKIADTPRNNNVKDKIKKFSNLPNNKVVPDRTVSTSKSSPNIKPKPNITKLPKENNPKLEIKKTGLASTTNEMISNNTEQRTKMYSIRDSGLYVSGQDIKVHGFKK